MKTRSIIYIILAGIFWGTSGIFVHYLAPYGFSSYQMTAARAIVSFTFILCYSLIKDRTIFNIKLSHLPLFLGIGISIFLTGSCYFLSMQMTSVSTAVVLMYTAPIYVMIFSVMFLGERLTRTGVASIVIMLAGCCLVSGVIIGLKFDLWGIVIGILSGIAYASYNVLTKISMQKGIKPLSVNLYSFAFMLLISLWTLEPKAMASSIAILPTLTVPLLIALGIFTFITPYFLSTLAMKELSASTASTLCIVEPMAATLFSAVILKEKIDVFSIVGIILILCAIFMIGRSQKD